MKPLLLLAIILPIAPAVAQAPPPDRVARLLGELADALGPPGFEEDVRRIVVREVRPLADKVSYDGLGSVIAEQSGAEQGGAGPRIMLDGHMDELGGVVRRVTPTGFLSMQMPGGWLDQALPDPRWVIVGRKGAVKAVTGIRDVHVVPPDERARVHPRDGLIDCADVDRTVALVVARIKRLDAATVARLRDFTPE